MALSFDRKVGRWVQAKPRRTGKAKDELLAEVEETLTSDEMADAVARGKKSPAKPRKKAAAPRNKARKTQDK